MLVKSSLSNKDRVAFWQRHPAHPGGEVFVTGDGTFEVGDTHAVREAVKNGVLIEVTPPDTENETLPASPLRLRRGK